MTRVKRLICMWTFFCFAREAKKKRSRGGVGAGWKFSSHFFVFFFLFRFFGASSAKVLRLFTSGTFFPLPKIRKNFPASHSISLTTARLAEIQPHQLHHVGLEEVDVPPWNAFGLRQRARLGGEERWGRSVDGLLRDARAFRGDLHWRLACRHVENCNEEKWFSENNRKTPPSKRN